jgi:hypothetical protein
LPTDAVRRTMFWAFFRVAHASAAGGPLKVIVPAADPPVRVTSRWVGQIEGT